jgi:DNA-binding transcriptional MerR regulator
MTKPLTIGALGRLAGATAKAVRHYEALGLLGAPRRSEAGYRLYGPEDVERLRFVMGAKALGLSLAEIKEIVGVWDAGERPCRHVRGRLDAKLGELDRRIAELTAFRDALRAYRDQVGPGADDVPCAHVAGALEGEWTPPAVAEASDLTPRLAQG